MEEVSRDSDIRGDILIRGFWRHGSDTICDVRISDTDAKSYQRLHPETVLDRAEKAKKKKYLHHCLRQRQHFTPLVFSPDGAMGRETKAFLRRLARHLAERWRRPYSHVAGYLFARISIACVRAAHRTLRGSRIPVDMKSYRFSRFDDGAGLHFMSN